MNLNRFAGSEKTSSPHYITPMQITASITNSAQQNDIYVATEKNKKTIAIAAKADGRGSSVNGGELLFLALATCFCNDTYREAARRSMQIDSVAVSVTGEFGKEGEPATNVVYNVTIHAPHHAPHEIQDLIHHVDTVAEVHNTLRQGVRVSLHVA
jgi:organic hydroperoxide reductase OsmC/OhrA